LTNDDEKAKVDYETFVREYVEKRGLQTMREVLEEYNIVDVLPFVEAIKKTRKLYYPDKIDMMKDAVSIPGLSIMMKDAVSIPGLSIRYAPNKALTEKKGEIVCAWRRV